MRRAVVAMLACLAAGVVLMIGFEEWYTRLFGVLALFAFVAGGVFLIADPKFLERDD